MRCVFSICALVLATASCVEADSCGASEGVGLSHGADELALIQLRHANAAERSASAREAIAAIAAERSDSAAAERSDSARAAIAAIAAERSDSTAAIAIEAMAAAERGDRRLNASLSGLLTEKGAGAFPGFDFGGGGGGGWGGDTQGDACSGKPGGFQCPKNMGCPSGDCEEDGPGGWESWVDAHNVRRCMHDVPAVTWSNAMYRNVKKIFKDQRRMGHSDCYKLKAPEGPAGENLAWASWSLTADRATEMWYSEIEDCGPFPGCSSGSTGAVGHFTALIWDGAKEIGCHANEHGLRACQYRGGDTFDCETPNNSRFYTSAVFKNVFSREECEKKLKKCKSGQALPDPDPQEHEEPDKPDPRPSPDPRRRSPPPDPRRRSPPPDPRRRSRPPDPRRRSPPDSGDDTAGSCRKYDCTVETETSMSWACAGKSQSSCEMRSRHGCAWTCVDPPPGGDASAAAERAEKAAERAEAAAEKAEKEAAAAADSAAAASKKGKQKEGKKKGNKKKKKKTM
jgi:hypothetical protein